MSPTERTKVLLFLALFFGAVGFLFMLLCCGTEYWLLAAESCSRPEEGRGEAESVRIFHEGLFWRCSFTVDAEKYSTWNLWLLTQPSSRLCQTAFLFPFPVKGLRAEPHGSPQEPYEPDSAIVFRTFWSIFLVSGVAAVVTGGFLVICAGPLSKHQLYKVGGTLQLCGGFVFVGGAICMFQPPNVGAPASAGCLSHIQLICRKELRGSG
ncbi:transmembrane protein 182-like isoform X2 [Echeneis naucrates]|uniref:transmembrane protein 182-like isoform X2 n=1 Tax=Echeneis naucrates TaxID=173247 RepID=UPI001113FC0C|nr:transmembrane protein 182-like isoform X2 [Echeneis naucrates]